MSAPGLRAFWLKHLHRWHWISAAMSLVGMVLFAATGITLNHAGAIEAAPKVTSRTAQLPENLLAALNASQQSAMLPEDVLQWIATHVGVSIGGSKVEWQKGEVYVSLPRPGGDAWLTIDSKSGDIEYELTDRGWISYLNDLHKGRHAGLWWSLFIDAFAVVCLIFCTTGFFLLQLHSTRRPATWPLVGFGVVVPIALLLLFVH
ncbi:MAG TPA: PepSY-associated TM helix domain-containing protein [Hyphomicrobium sp.]|nr:PepSY-associated TM helix domain-containing protein [Hyphomicrobium sp.]